MSAPTTVTMLAEEAIELGELLEFVARWLEGAEPAVTTSFARYMGTEGYALCDLCHDLLGFSFVLGAAETCFEEGR